MGHTNCARPIHPLINQQNLQNFTQPSSSSQPYDKVVSHGGVGSPLQKQTHNLNVAVQHCTTECCCQFLLSLSSVLQKHAGGIWMAVHACDNERSQFLV